jgi:hypothetical protein
MELWSALWLVLKTPLAHTNVTNTLVGMLSVDLSLDTDSAFWSGDSISNNWHWLGIGLLCGCWFLSLWHWWTRYWALFPFRCAWHFLIHLQIWCLALREHRDRNEHTDECSGHQGGNETSDKVYKGPIVQRGPRSNNYGLIQPVTGDSGGRANKK